MNKCPNCGMSEDKVRSKRINREAYYCGTDKVGLAVTGRISVACAEIRRLQAINADLLTEVTVLENYLNGINNLVQLALSKAKVSDE